VDREDESLRVLAFNQGCLGDAEKMLKLWHQQPATEPADIVEAYALGLGLAMRGDAAAVPLIERLEQRGFAAEARLLQAELALQRGDLQRGMQLLLDALAAQRQGPIPLCNVSRQTLQRLGSLASKNPQLARVALAALAQGPLISHLRERERIDWIERLGYATLDPTLCIQAMERSLENPWWSRTFLERRYECLKAAQHPLAQQAEHDLIEFLMATPGSFGSTESGSVKPSATPVEDPSVPPLLAAPDNE
jgi:hypothetical protein